MRAAPLRRSASRSNGPRPTKVHRPIAAALLTAAGAALPSWGVTRTYTPNSPTVSWSTAGNWTGGIFPTAFDTAILQPGIFSNVIVTYDGSVLAANTNIGALTIDAIMDFAGDRTGNFRMIQCEVQSHDAFGTPRELFGKFFGVIGETLRAILGADWSPEIGEAWRQLLMEIDQFLSVPGSSQA